MYTEAGVHRLPHFHAYYGEYLASFAVDPPGFAGRIITSTPIAIGISLG
jgi:hypothetical protein